MWELVAGRQTGSEGWRAARGELGNLPSSSSGAANATAFRMADDGSVQSSEPGRLCGGVVRASGEHRPDQTAVRVRLHAWLTAVLHQRAHSNGPVVMSMSTGHGTSPDSRGNTMQIGGIQCLATAQRMNNVVVLASVDDRPQRCTMAHSSKLCKLSWLFPV